MNNLKPYEGKKLLITENQNTPDIMREVYQSHKHFAGDYDKLIDNFFESDPVKFAKEVFNYCKKNLVYRQESENFQTTRSPAAILHTKKVDCKHYASFIAGSLDALRRKYNLKFDLYFRFGNYSIFDTMPGHVFVVMVLDGIEYWIDPVLNKFNQRDPLPVSFIDKKIRNMSLVRISGLTPSFAMTERVKEKLSGVDLPTTTAPATGGNKYLEKAVSLSSTLNLATADIPFYDLAKGILTSFFGEGGISDWLSPSGILNELKFALQGRAFRGGQYWLGEKFKYYILGLDIHTRDADIVTDEAVLTAINVFSVGLGVPIEDYQDILNLREGAQKYIDRYVLLGADRNDIYLPAVERAVTLVNTYFPGEKSGNFSSKGVAPTLWNPNDFNRLPFVAPIPDFTKPYAQMWKNTFTGVVPGGAVKDGIVVTGKLYSPTTGNGSGSAPGAFSLNTILIVGGVLVGAYLIFRKKR